jgi:hypothetical protein
VDANHLIKFRPRGSTTSTVYSAHKAPDVLQSDAGQGSLRFSLTPRLCFRSLDHPSKLASTTSPKLT